MHQAADGQRLTHHLLKLAGVQRLDQVIVGAEFHGLDGGVGRAVSRDEDDEALGIELVKIVEDIEPGAVAEPDVEQDHIRRFFGGQLQTFGGRLGTENLDAFLCENLLDAEANARLVVNYQQFCHWQPHSVLTGYEAASSLGMTDCLARAVRCGRRAQRQFQCEHCPAFRAVAAESVPPCSSAMRWLTASPKPVPCSLLVTNGSKIRSRTGLRDTAARIGDQDPTAAAAPIASLNRDGQRSSLRHGLDAVEKQVDKDLVELLGIAVHHNGSLRQLLDNGNILMFGSPLDQIRGAAHRACADRARRGAIPAGGQNPVIPGWCSPSLRFPARPPEAASPAVPFGAAVAPPSG